MDFLINVRFFKEEKLGQGECWREFGSCLLKTDGGSTDALDLPEAVFFRDLFSDLEMPVSCNQIPSLPMSPCQKTLQLAWAAGQSPPSADDHAGPACWPDLHVHTAPLGALTMLLFDSPAVIGRRLGVAFGSGEGHLGLY